MRFLERERTQDLDEREDAAATEQARGSPGKRTRTMAIGRSPQAPPGPWAPGRLTRTMTRSSGTIQMKTAAAHVIETLGAALENTGLGRSIPEHVRRRMEAVFGADFSAVRIHEGPQAQAMGALAYTWGTDIYFAPGMYDPESRRGQELLGHELAHVVQQAQGRVQPTAQVDGVGINESGALESEADQMGAKAAAGPAGPPAAPRTVAAPVAAAAIQRQPDPDAAKVDAVKSKEIELAEDGERTDWPVVVKRYEKRMPEIGYLVTTTLIGDQRALLKRLASSWDDTVVAQPDFDPVRGALDVKDLRRRIAADRADAAKLAAKKFKSLVGWVESFAKTLESFLASRRRVEEERTEFRRFDSSFLDADVKQALAAVPGDFRPAHLKAMLAQETGDFTDTNIAGLKGKTKGIVHKLTPNPSFVGIGQVHKDTDKDARKMAKELGIKLPEKTDTRDPRADPAIGIKLVASYLAYIGKQLDQGLPTDQARPTGAAMRKLVIAAYNGGPFGLLKAVGIVSSKGAYTWESISKNEAAMKKFSKPREVRDYVQRVIERAP